MISIYSSAFNIIKNKFDYKFAIDNFCFHADEVIITVNESSDNTLDVLTNLMNKYSNLSINSSSYSYDDPLLDGKIKNHSLQLTTNPIKIGLDIDEYIPRNQKDIWRFIAKHLNDQEEFMCYMIPSINLYKDYDHFTSIIPKWYMHKAGLFRGPVNFAKKNNGYIDTSKSDSCELIDSNENLVSSRLISPVDISQLRLNNFIPNSYAFVVHTGYVSFENRLLRNNNFWKNHWKVESGGTDPIHKVHLEKTDFTEKYQRHLLNIE